MMQQRSEHIQDDPPIRLPKKKRHRVHTATLWSICGIGVFVLLLVIGSYVVDEPLRRYMETTLNAQLHGYTVRLPHLDFHPLGFSVSLNGLTITQDAHPEPPVARIEELRASVHWRALLHARVVADFLFKEPWVHINRPQLQHEAADKVPLKDKGWQAALESIYPLQINRFRILDGDLTYIDDDPARPLHLSRLNLTAGNIRNIRSADHAYPSEIHLDGTIFDTGRVRLDGHANFLAQPHAGIDAEASLSQVDLGYFKSILARLNLWITAGVLSADGHVEYAPGTARVHLTKLTVRGVQLDYTHSAQTAAAEQQRVTTVEHTAQELRRAPVAAVRIDELDITDSTVGYVDHAVERGYRVFLANSDLTIKNLSNQARDGPASITLNGAFMGSGESMVQATVWPAEKNLDLNLSVMIEGAQLRSLNDLLRAFGNFDVTAGTLSFYSELAVKNGEIAGYFKPIFKNVQVYSRRQDAKKPIVHQLYEELIQGLQTALQNGHGEVSTKVDISGVVSEPETSTWQAILGLLRNAFIQAIGHGFEAQTEGSPDRQTN